MIPRELHLAPSEEPFPRPVTATQRGSPLLIVILAVVITVIVLILLLALVPSFDSIYTWLKPTSVKSDKVTVGVTLSTKNDAVKSIADALSEFINAMVETLCPHKDELLGLIDLLPKSAKSCLKPAKSYYDPHSPAERYHPRHPETEMVACPPTHCSATMDHMQAAFDRSPLGKDPKAKAALSKLLSAFTGTMCTEDHLDHDKTVSMMKAMVEAIC